MKKILVIIGAIFVFLLIAGLITSYLDSARVRTNMEPKFVIKTISKNGDKVTYWGLGYKVIRYVGISPKEPFESNVGLKYGSWFMNYETEERCKPIIDNGSEANYKKEIDDTTIKLNIPENWKFEELPQNAENDFYKYALKLYKSNENQYAVLYLNNEIFGVCGTGRTSKELYLNNGNKAIVGYYDGKVIWEDISFYEINRYVSVINCGLDKEESEEVLDFIKTINISENNKTKESISLLLKEDTLTSKNATFVLKNEGSEIYTYGPEYAIEEKNNSGWCKIELDSPLSWNAVLYKLNANTSEELNIDFTNGYGELSAGKEYRFVKEIYKEGQRDGIYLYAEFEVK